MDYIETRCLAVLRLQLVSVGLWPYENSWLIFLQRIVLSAFFAIAVLSQLTTLVMKDCNSHCILRNITFLSLPVIYFMKYCCFIYLRKDVKGLLDKIRCDWNSITCQEEHSIIVADMNSARKLGMFACVLSQIWPGILDVFVPLNESHPKNKAFIQVDILYHQEHYLFDSVYTDLAGFIGSTITIGTETLFILSVQHTCSLFNIVCHRIDTTLDNTLQHISGIERNRIIRSRIVSAIRMHHQALEFLDYWKGTFTVHYFIATGFVIIGLSLLLFRESSMLLLMVDQDELLMNTFLILAHCAYMFYVNYIGQMVIDRSGNIFTKIYDAAWYTAPVTTRRILLFFMENSLKPSAFVPGSIFLFCMEGFTTMASTALSYFTVIYSMLIRDQNNSG